MRTAECESAEAKPPGAEVVGSGPGTGCVGSWPRGAMDRMSGAGSGSAEAAGFGTPRVR